MSRREDRKARKDARRASRQSVRGTRQAKRLTSRSARQTSRQESKTERKTIRLTKKSGRQSTRLQERQQRGASRRVLRGRRQETRLRARALRKGTAGVALTPVPAALLGIEDTGPFQQTTPQQESFILEEAQNLEGDVSFFQAPDLSLEGGEAIEGTPIEPRSGIFGSGLDVTGGQATTGIVIIAAIAALAFTLK